MPQSLGDTYDTFVAAIIRGDHEAMRACVSADFSAAMVLSIEGAGRRRLNFDNFTQEIERQRRAFPDLWQNVTRRRPASGDSARVLHKSYVAIATFSGVLIPVGGGTPQQGNNKQIEIATTERINFNAEGKICLLTITTTNAAEVVEKLDS